jgi:hypothetical protein
VFAAQEVLEASSVPKVDQVFQVNQALQAIPESQVDVVKKVLKVQ